jgi:hypothetical protein
LGFFTQRRSEIATAQRKLQRLTICASSHSSLACIMQSLACHPDEGRICEQHKKKRSKPVQLLTTIVYSIIYRSLLRRDDKTTIPNA